MDDFGVRVRAARVAAGLTQLELARAMGYSTRSTISRIESGDNQVPMDRLDALAAALRTTPAYLLGQDGAAAEPAAPQAAAPEDDPFLQEFWRCAHEPAPRPAGNAAAPDARDGRAKVRSLFQRTKKRPSQDGRFYQSAMNHSAVSTTRYSQLTLSGVAVNT